MTTSGPTETAQPDATRPTWLVMVYMQAGDNSQLDNLAIQDLFEMEAGVRENPHVQVLVQIQRRWPAVPQRYLLKSGALPRVVPGPEPKDEDDDLLNMGTSPALKNFLDAGLEVGRRSDAQNYCLVLWGHAFGLGFGRDHGDALHLNELQKALETTFRKERGSLEILATNSCTMSYIEAAYELKDDVKYLAASQVFVPLTGLPYKEILTSIDSEMEPEQLGRTIINRYVEHFVNSPQGERVAMALLDLGRADTFSDLLNGIAGTITDIIAGGSRTDSLRLAEIQDVFFVNPAGDVRPVLDLHSLALDLKEFAGDQTASPERSQRARQADARTEKQRRDAQYSLEELSRQADLLAAAISGADGQAGAAASGTRSKRGAPLSTQLVIHHKEHPDLGELRGIGVFAPFVVDKEFRKQLEIDNPTARARDDDGRRRYERLKIFTSTNGGAGGSWPKLVYDTLRREEPDEIVDATGVVLPAARLQVNQLLVAVEAAFNRLDSVLRSAEPQVVTAVAQTRKNKDRARRILERFGPPILKLAGGLSLGDAKRFHLDPKRRAGQKPRKKTAPDQNPNEDEPVVSTLARIEQAVQLVEKTCKRVVTNRTFGLGPPSSTSATLLHLGGPKEAGDVFGSGPKEAGDVFGPLGSEKGAMLAFLSSDAQVAGLAVSALFTRVALVLVRLERAAAVIESAAAQFLFEPAHGKMLSGEHYEQAVRQRFERTFGVMKEASLQARRSIRRILAHPLYGLGPGPEGLGQEERDELAAAAGLNRRSLRLL